MAAPTQRARTALSNRLRELRRATGLTGTEFAERLGPGWGQPRVSRFETGKRLPTPHDIEAWAKATGADPRELLALLDRARHEYATFRDQYAAVGGADHLQDAIATAESAASRIAQYQPALILGLLQTADYAREMLHLPGGPASSGASEDEISRMIAARQRRQAILYEPGRDITLVMGEGALRTRLASPVAMRAQLEHLARLAETLTTATIAVVPFTARAPVPTLNGWSILDDIVTIETDGGDLEIADPEEVERYWQATWLLLEAAATGPDAAALTRRVLEETT